MLQRIKFKNNEHSKLFLIGCSHFNHNKDFIFKARGYNSIQEHDEGLIKIWNERVRPQDSVLHLGDFMLNGSAESCKNIVGRLNGRLYLINGNHNGFIKSLYFEALAFYCLPPEVEAYNITWENKVTFLGDYIHASAEGISFCASHFPFRIWDKMKHGIPFFNSHSHGGDVESNPDDMTCKRIDCGVENFGGPVAFDDLMKIMDKKGISKLDQHH